MLAVVADVVFGTGLAGFGLFGSGVEFGIGIIGDEVGFEVVVSRNVNDVRAKLAGSIAQVLEVRNGYLHGVEESGGGALIDAAVEESKGHFGDAYLDGFG